MKLIQIEFIAALKNKFENLYRSYFEHNKNGRELLLEYVKNGWNLEIESDEIQQLQTLGAFLSYAELNNYLIINNSLQSLNKTTIKNKYLLLPLLSIAIKSELQKINSTFGYYPAATTTNNDDPLPQTPSISSFPLLFNQTPTNNHRNKYNKNNNNNQCGNDESFKFLPKSFGLSVLTNVLTK